MTQERFYNLLPRVYRRLDLDKGQPLRALMAVLESEYNTLEQDINNLYDNWFIETCAQWCIPYLGDLLGITGLTPSKKFPGSWRTLVANTLHNRRRKGTTPVLEKAARDATGWYSLAVEFFEGLSITQSLHHLRPEKGKTIDIKNKNVIQALNTPFEKAAYTVDIRGNNRDKLQPVTLTNTSRGKYNIPNIGLFLWPLQSYPVTGSDACKINEGYYTFSPFGINIPLFNQPETQQHNQTGLEEDNLPIRLKREGWHFKNLPLKLKHHPVFRVYIKRDPALETPTEPENNFVSTDTPQTQPDFWETLLSNSGLTAGYTGFFEIQPENMRIVNLEHWRVPVEFLYDQSVVVVIDPETGRLVFLHDLHPAGVKVEYSYGFSGNIGGGPYSHETINSEISKAINAYALSAEDTQIPLEDLKETNAWTARVSAMYPENLLNRNNQENPSYIENPQAVTGNSYFNTLTDALTGWSEQNRNGVIRITDSGTYGQPGTSPSSVEKAGYTVTIPVGRWIVIQAAEGQVPFIIGNIEIIGTGPGSRIDLIGLWIHGTITISGDVAVHLHHCTIMPQRQNNSRHHQNPALLAHQDQCRDVSVTVTQCITGPLHLPETIRHLHIFESIIDGLGGNSISASPTGETTQSTHTYGPPVVIEKTTLFGPVAIARLHQADDVLFTAPVSVKNANDGYVRYSNIPLNSNTSMQYQCLFKFHQSDINSFFYSTHYGQPGYGRLRPESPLEIRTGAGNGSEIGAFNHLFHPQREANLTDMLKEYFPVGFKPEVFYVL